MKMDFKSHFNYYKNAGLYKYSFFVILIIFVSFAFSFASESWEHVSRCGGLITVFGVFLLSRDLIRLGPYKANEPKPPVNIPRGRMNEINMPGIWAEIAEKTDNYSKHIGIYIVVIGTILWSYGDWILQYFWPYNT